MWLASLLECGLCQVDVFCMALLDEWVVKVIISPSQTSVSGSLRSGEILAKKWCSELVEPQADVWLAPPKKGTAPLVWFWVEVTGASLCCFIAAACKKWIKPSLSWKPFGSCRGCTSCWESFKGTVLSFRNKNNWLKPFKLLNKVRFWWCVTEFLQPEMAKQGKFSYIAQQHTNPCNSRCFLQKEFK